MPEIGEVARVVHYLRKHLAGKTLATVKVQEDGNVYGKTGTTAAEFQKAMTGKKVLDARQQGKYFWLVMSSPPHPLMHLGMTGWIKFSNDDSAYYKPPKGEADEWPPKYWKFILRTKEEPTCETAFVDSRRFARIRLIDCDGAKIRQVAPLSKNGPDPVQDRDLLTKQWFIEKVQSRKVPIKAFLLDQGMISGIGNWVGDEILYHAKVHPEQYTTSLKDSQLAQLHDSILHICSIAVDTLADSSKFPAEWLMKYRWGKGKKDNRLPNGARITFFTVGGRTSAVVASVQKKTGPVAGDVPSESKEDQDEEKPATTKQVQDTPTAANGKAKRTPKKDQEEEEAKSAPKKTKRKTGDKNGPDDPSDNSRSVKRGKKAITSEKENDENPAFGRRRSARVSRNG